jgi:hypothetical protein
MSSHAAILCEPALGVVLSGTKLRLRLVPRPGPVVDPMFWEQRAVVKWFWATNVASGQPGGPEHKIEQEPLEDTKEVEKVLEQPGHYKIIARYLVRSHAEGQEAHEEHEAVEHSIWVSAAETVLDQVVAKQLQSKIPHPAAALSAMRRYDEVLSKLTHADGSPVNASHIVIRGDAQLARRARFCDELEKMLQSTHRPRLNPAFEDPFGDGRLPIAAAWVDKTNPSTAKPLNVFVQFQPDSNGQFSCRLVHWTDPLSPAMHSEHLGKGLTQSSAMEDAVNEWARLNRLPPGKIEVNSGTQAGAAVKKVFDTPGPDKTPIQTISEVADSVAFALGVMTAITLLVLPVPGSQVLAAAVWTLTVSSAVAGASSSALKIAQRHEEGMGNWQQDTLDTLNIVANLVPCGGQWARGAKVLGAFDTQALYYGEMLSFGIQGVAVVRDVAVDWDKILSDPNLDGNQKVMELLKATAKGVVHAGVIYVGVRGTQKDMARWTKAQRPTPDLADVRPHIKAMQEEWLDAKKTIAVERKKSPKFGGHTEEGQHKTVVEEDQHPPTSSKPKPPGPRPTPPKPAPQMKPAKPPPERGMRHIDDVGFEETARKEKLWIVVRDSSPAATKHIGFGKQAKLARGKPESLKAKTLREGPNAGLVAANPNDKRMIELLAAEKPTMTPEALTANPAEKTRRYQNYVKELEAGGFKVDGPENDFLVFKPDVETGKVYFHSDYDLHGVYSAETGQPVNSETIRGKFNTDAEKDMVLHGAHDEWSKRNSVEAGPNGGPQPPATAYGPNGEKLFLENREQFKQFYECTMPSKEPFPWPYNWPAPLN